MVVTPFVWPFNSVYSSDKDFHNLTVLFELLIIINIILFTYNLINLSYDPVANWVGTGLYWQHKTEDVCPTNLFIISPFFEFQMKTSL